MYKSPIDLIYKDVLYHMEQNIYTAVQNFDIQVDRDELIKALKYDREQYYKGYEDGKKERRMGRWIEDGYLNLPAVCSCCGEQGRRFWNFCPYCGADMREE